MAMGLSIAVFKWQEQSICQLPDRHRCFQQIEGKGSFIRSRRWFFRAGIDFFFRFGYFLAIWGIIGTNLHSEDKRSLEVGVNTLRLNQRAVFGMASLQ
jgi:hypothetical protein